MLSQEIGRFRSRVIIEVNTPSVDVTGQPIASWATLVTRWASLEPIQGTEMLNAQQIAAEVTHRVRLRFETGIDHGHRINYGGRIFEIVSILNHAERGAELELLCKETL